MDLLFLLSAVVLCRGEWVLTWQDEFNGHSLDLNKWTVVKNQSHCCDPFGQEELQLYMPDRISVENGYLRVQTKWDPTVGPKRGGGSKIFNYTSGEIQSRGHFSQKYGRWEANCSLPPRIATGIWPAFWLMPDSTQCWPTGGEVDIFEFNGNTYEDFIFGSYHWAKPSKCGDDQEPLPGSAYAPTGWKSDWQTEWHLYAVEWTPTSLSFFVDNDMYFSKTANQVLLPTAPLFIILNQAIDQTVFSPKPGNPAYQGEGVSLKVDYVRVYKQK